MFSQTELTLTFGLKDDVLKLCTRFDIIDWFPDVRNIEWTMRFFEVKLDGRLYVWRRD